MAYNLSAYLERPFVVKRDLTKVPLKETISQLNDFMKADQSSSQTPETDALNFYLLNHAFSVLRMKYNAFEPVNGDHKVADEYFSKKVAVATARAFYYLLLICTRESRHVHKTNNFHDKLKAKYGTKIHDFNREINGSGSNSAAMAVRNSPPDVELGQYTDSLVFTFYKGIFGGGYGGPKWGKVADCLNDFVWGRTSAEMMMDSVWTLCHNNGPIFNKGMLYGHYSSELVTILDVQRAGQIPNLINDHRNGIKYVSAIQKEHIDTYERLLEYLPEELDGYTDWGLIEALGSNHKYANFKTKQKQHHGESEEEVKAKAAAKKLQEQKKAEEEAKKKYWFITPTQKVETFERVKETA